MTMSKTCLTCHKSIRGRIDKKFCDDYCRSTYNNRLNSEGAPYLRLINSALKRNRRILEDVFPQSEQVIKLERSQLLENGFDFKYYTHSWKEPDGHTFTCCYEFGYRTLEDDVILLIRLTPNGQ